MSDRFSYTLEDAIAHMKDVYLLTQLDADRNTLQHLKDLKEVKDNLTQAKKQAIAEFNLRQSDRRVGA